MSRMVEVIWMESPGIHASSFAERKARLKPRVKILPANRHSIAFRMEYQCNQSCRLRSGSKTQGDEGEQLGGDAQAPVRSPVKLRSENRRKNPITADSECTARLIVSYTPGLLLIQFQCTADQVVRRVVQVWQIPAPVHPLPDDDLHHRVSPWARARLHVLANSWGMTKSRLQIGKHAVLAVTSVLAVQGVLTASLDEHELAGALSEEAGRSSHCPQTIARS